MNKSKFSLAILLFAAAFVTGCVTDTAHLKVGIISDVHMSGSMIERTEQALRYFSDAGADGIIVAGDITNNGRQDETEMLIKVWNKVFPDGTNSLGGRVERLFVTGNHDHYKSHVTNNWKLVAGEEWTPVWRKNVKGYEFVGMNFGQQGRVTPFIDAAADAAAGKPFFYIQHAHPPETVYSNLAWGAVNGGCQARNALAKYPNGVAFSGHSHWSLTDDQSIWQGEFTSVGTASLSYLGARWERDNTAYFTRGKKSMSPKKSNLGSQGLLMSVYADRIVLDRHDFLYNEGIDDAWVIPLPVAENKPYSFEGRATASIAPEFPEGAALKVVKVAAKSTNDVATLRVTVPMATFKGVFGDRVFDYEVQVRAALSDSDPYVTKRVVEAKYAERHERMRGSLTNSFTVCCFSENEFPKDVDLEVVARPCNAFGIAGRPIIATVAK